MSNDQTPSSDSLIFYLHAGKLVDMAAVSLLAALKHHKMTQIHRGNKEMDIKSYEMDLISVEFPESITDMLCDVSDCMDESIAKWWKYHWEQVFFRNMPSNDMITLFDQLVWLHDGSISFEQTARKLVNSSILTNVQKFQIACTYCFIDDVNRLKETLSSNEMHLATESFCTDVDPFLEYWCCKIRRMTGLSRLTNTNNNLFFSELIHPFCRKYYNHWPVVQYFWNQSPNEEERLKKAKQMIFSGTSPVELIWHFLPKLSSPQLDSLMMEYGIHIMTYFAEEPNYIEYTMLIWKRVLNVINDSDLNYLLRHMTDIQQNRDYVDGLLLEMWLCMSEQQKKLVAYQQELEYVAKWIENIEYDSPMYRIIVDVLSFWDSERRRQYWTANWTSLVIGEIKHKSKIEEIMKIIFDSNENIAVFKRTYLTNYNSIRAACEELLKYGRCEELQNYLNYSTADQEVIRSLRKQILTTMPKDEFFWVFCERCDDESLNAEFEYFLRDIFTVDEIKDFQRDVLMANLEKMEGLLLEGSVHELIQCVEKYLSNEEDLYAIKLHFIKYSRDHHEIATKIEMADWVDFSSWCYEGKSSLTERFKSSLQSAEVSEDVEMEQNSLYESFCNFFLSKE